MDTSEAEGLSGRHGNLGPREGRWLCGPPPVVGLQAAKTWPPYPLGGTTMGQTGHPSHMMAHRLAIAHMNVHTAGRNGRRLPD